jgi:hypothetical protein
MAFITERLREIKRRRHRKAKLTKLKAKYLAASTKAEREKVAAKIKRISFFMELPTK